MCDVWVDVWVWVVRKMKDAKIISGVSLVRYEV